MGGKLKIEIAGEKNILEIFESEQGQITFVMYPEDPNDDTWLDVIVETSEFSALLNRLIGSV